MFTLTLDTPQPDAALAARARDELAVLIEIHCRIRRADLLHHREYWIASRHGSRGRADRFRNADIARSEASLKHLFEVEALAAEQAAAQLPALLREIGGLVRAYDLGSGHLGVRVDVPGTRLQCRALLLPEPSRRARIQMQPYVRRTPPPGLQDTVDSPLPKN